MRRMLAIVIGLLTVLFGLVDPTSAMANSTLPPPAYGYDNCVTPAQSDGTVTERGPPTTHDRSQRDP